mgnify:CR=1 FL=1
MPKILCDDPHRTIASVQRVAHYTDAAASESFVPRGIYSRQGGVPSHSAQRRAHDGGSGCCYVVTESDLQDGGEDHRLLYTLGA